MSNADNQEKGDKVQAETRNVQDCGCDKYLAMSSIAPFIEKEETEQVSPESDSMLQACTGCGNGNTGTGTPGVERQVSSNNIAASETSLARSGNSILYGYNDLSTGNFAGFSFSSDGGTTWSICGDLPTNPNGFNDGDPVMAVDRNGVFYYGQLSREQIPQPPPNPPALESVISVSTGTVDGNGCLTMNPPQVVGRGTNPSSTRGTQDKEWITVGPDFSNLGNEALYITWTDFTTNPTSIRFSKYTTGVTLNPIIQNMTIVSGGNFVTGTFVLVDNAGIIYVFYEDNSGFATLAVPNRRIRMVRSLNGGTSFQPAVDVSNLFAAAADQITNCNNTNRPTIQVGTQNIRMNEFPHAAIGPDGTIYVVWNEGRVVGGTTFIDIILGYSQNAGVTWNRVNITNSLPYKFFPTVAANQNGAHIQYNRFNDPNGVGGIGDGTFAIFMKTFSLNTGLSEERQISTQFSPVTTFQCYMGDYNQIIRGPGNSLLHSWGDNRNSGNPVVFFLQSDTIDLSLEKSDSQDPVKLGDNLTYTINVRNLGPSAANNVMLIDTLPNEVDFLSSTSSQGSCTEVNGVVTCNLGTIMNGATATVTIKVKPKTTGTFCNTARVSASELDTNELNNTVTQCTTVLETKCMEVTEIIDSCIQQEIKEEIVKVPGCNCTSHTCQIVDTQCRVKSVTPPDPTGNVSASLLIRICVKITCKEFTREECFTFSKTVTLKSSPGAEVKCQVKDSDCTCTRIAKNKVRCILTFTVLTKSVQTLQLNIPFIGECNPRNCNG
ncbi:DUF11 domain-containing protein [Bacillus sp. FJAT-49705]|uniref:DUF11 domain-containing protein n=1 Tax=Cytobacillus citreus TaxID=2833586 RepID=A0ABS5NR40_9BACI|nr:DUF11 domain-containing protein [Cytobacillus citreus]MBS4189893.1 DUF11 domain-containing protein [Cytobacillus citreus]